HVLRLVKQAGTPVFLLLNKIDLIPKDRLLPLIERYSKLYEFKEIIPISARKKEGLDVLLDSVVAALPRGPRYFAEDELTDQPARFMAAEIIREQVLLATGEEVPYSTTVILDEFEEKPKLTRIAATIYCEREGQKAILIGRQGQMLKKIGTQARLEIEAMLGAKVFLELFVKVRPGWRNSREFVEGLDWRRQLERLAGGRSDFKEP
ncbi:MAG TPA: GTPase Era, partial [Terriglobales bacterium]|nr:GTPase Era [Terriglobales bacterium]